MRIVGISSDVQVGMGMRSGSRGESGAKGKGVLFDTFLEALSRLKKGKGRGAGVILYCAAFRFSKSRGGSENIGLGVGLLLVLPNLSKRVR